MMSDAEPAEVVPPQISELLENRSILLAWLERLTDRRDDVREEVYRRVRSDYQERLEEVERDLVAHRSDLERSLDRRREAVSELEEERESRAARLEEAELRHDVGELDEEAFEEEASDHRRALEELDGKLAESREAAERLAEVLEELSDLETTGGSGMEPPEPDSRERTPPEAGASEEPEEDDRDAPAAAEPDGSSAGRAEEPPAGPEEEPGAESAEGAGPAPSTGTEEGGEEPDELDFLESLSLDDPDSLDTLSMDLNEEEEPRDEEEGG